MVRGMAHAEHPLVTAHGTHAAANLIGERLKGNALVNDGKRAGNGIAGAGGFLHLEKMLQCFLEPPLQQVFEAFERNHARRARWQFGGQMKPMNGVEKEQGADAFVKIITTAAEGFQFRARGEQLICGQRRANEVQRLIALLRIRRRDDFQKARRHGLVRLLLGE